VDNRTFIFYSNNNADLNGQLFNATIGVFKYAFYGVSANVTTVYLLNPDDDATIIAFTFFC